MDLGKPLRHLFGSMLPKPTLYDMPDRASPIPMGMRSFRAMIITAIYNEVQLRKDQK